MDNSQRTLTLKERLEAARKEEFEDYMTVIHKDPQMNAIFITTLVFYVISALALTVVSIFLKKPSSVGGATFASVLCVVSWALLAGLFPNPVTSTIEQPGVTLKNSIVVLIATIITAVANSYSV
jgi:hypothetical protein